MSKKNILSVVLILIFGLWAIHSLFTPGFYTSHDGEHHLTRMANYYLTLIDGQFPPRWAPNFNGGLGSPIFVYIYPLPYLIGAALHFLKLSFVDSFKLAIGASYLLSGLSFYYWLKPKLGNLSALVGAIFYLWAPYRFLMIFVRGAYPESLAYTFVPLVLICLDNLSKNGKKRWIGLGALSISGLMLSQNLVAFIFIPISIFYIFLTLRTQINKTVATKLIITILLGLSLSAFIYIPDIFELKNTQYARLMTYSQGNFVYFWQFFRSPWGYGFSLGGDQDGMSFQIGLTQILVVLMTVFMSLVIFIRQMKIKIVKNPNFPIVIFSLVSFLGVVVLMTETKVTHSIWLLVPGLSTIDYPWRLLGVTVFAAAFMAAWLISIIPGKLKILLAGALLIALTVANRNFLRVNQSLDLSDQYLLTYSGRDTHLGEFTPNGRISTDAYPNNQKSGEFYDGQGRIIRQQVNPTKRLFDITVFPKEGESKFRINTFYFPGWKINVDSQKVDLGKGLEVTGGIDIKTNTDTSGMIGIALPSGNHRVEAVFKETPLRQFADTLSLVSLIICVGAIFL